MTNMRDNRHAVAPDRRELLKATAAAALAAGARTHGTETRQAPGGRLVSTAWALESLRDVGELEGTPEGRFHAAPMSQIRDQGSDELLARGVMR